MRRQVSEEQVLQWFETLCNWRKWGPEDRLGTLNYITDAKRAEAANSVEHGVSVSCAWDVDMNEVNQPRVSPQRWMARSGLGWGEDLPADSIRPMDSGMAGASESISMVFHGLSITHLDSLSHIFWNGQMYGGLPASYVTDVDGAMVHDVRSTQCGIQTRGVLLDIPASRSLEFLNPGDPIFPEDLEAAELAQEVAVESGDAVFVRTGNGLRRIRGRWAPEIEGCPGLHAECLPWLQERQVAVLGSDVPQDVRPCTYEKISQPIHAIGIVAMGLSLLDNCQLEDLARACREYGRWNFLLSVGPLRLAGVTGSPVNPIALF